MADVAEIQRNMGKLRREAESMLELSTQYFCIEKASRTVAEMQKQVAEIRAMFNARGLEKLSIRLDEKRLLEALKQIRGSCIGPGQWRLGQGDKVLQDMIKEKICGGGHREVPGIDEATADRLSELESSELDRLIGQFDPLEGHPEQLP